MLTYQPRNLLILDDGFIVDTPAFPSYLKSPVVQQIASILLRNESSSETLLAIEAVCIKNVPFSNPLRILLADVEIGLDPLRISYLGPEPDG